MFALKTGQGRENQELRRLQLYFAYIRVYSAQIALKPSGIESMEIREYFYWSKILSEFSG